MEDLTVPMVAICYYLYRQSGAPYGDNIQGFTMWYDIQLQHFCQFAQETRNNENETQQ